MDLFGTVYLYPYEKKKELKKLFGSWKESGDEDKNIEDLYDSSSSYVQLVLQETQYRDQQALELILTKSSQDSSYQSVVRENGKIPIKIGGYNALKVTKNQEITAVLKKDDDYYTLHIRKNEQNLLPIRSQEISKIFDQILSTFKFL